MDDFPLDIEELESPSTSVLDALCTLNPPSPILTPSQLTFAWSSGDIPVLLYDEGYAKDAVASYELSAPTESVDCDGDGTLDDSVSVDSPCSAVINSRSGVLESLESSSTFTSVGTFGPMHRNSAVMVGQPIRDSFVSTESIGSLSQSQVVTSDSNGLTAGPPSQSLLTDSFPLNDSPPKVFYHPIVYVEGKKPLLGAETDISVTVSEPEPDEPFEASVDNTSLDRPLSWISSRSWDYTRYKDFVSSQPGLVTHPVQVHHLRDSHMELATSTSAFHLADDDTETCDSYAHEGDNNSAWHEQSPTRSKRLSHPVNHLAVPSEHSPKPSTWLSPIGPTIHKQKDTDWLNDIYLDFLIDQEGFRAAHPLFRFTGIVRQRWSAYERSGLIDTVAQFKPVSRQIFHFHYAPFETPPILRRITVNGDDTHDYVSRQGLLSLKANGVYLLQGQELPAGSHHFDSDVVKLQWQFEYLVDDRIADSSGKVMGGEKTLTPLTFSCSPALLLPIQAKKNSIIHVFKKGMAPKLHAEKFQPPVQITPTPAKNVNTSGGTPPRSVQVHTSSKTQSPGSLHRRGMSHSLHYNDATARLQGSFNNRGAFNVDNKGSNSPVNTRRNSSAGEQVISPIRPEFNAKKPPVHKNNPEDDLNVNQFTGRHIISPKKLVQLFDSPEKENTSVQGPVTPQSDSSYKFPLFGKSRDGLAKGRNPLLL